MTRGARPERALDALVRERFAPRAGETLGIACSGGPDSIALASLADRLAGEVEAKIALLHVNHAVRTSSDQDECVVLSAAARLDCAVHVVRLTPARDDEAALREARYTALAQVAAAAGATVVATAHTAEDQTETVLLALFRGTGLNGLTGIPPRRELTAGVTLVRPLLRVSRAELATELRASGLAYALDPTNAALRYRRNALRAHLDALRAEFPGLDRAVARCAEIVREDIAATPRARDRRALRERLRADGELRDVSFAMIEAALREGAGAE